MPSAITSPFAILLEAVSDESASLDRLVRAAEVLAREANDVLMVSWCERELNGYPPDDVPDYRKAAAMLQATDNYGRTSPVTSKDTSLLEAMAECPIVQPLSAMKELIAGPQNAEFKVYFHPDTEVRLLKAIPAATEVFRIVQANSYRTAIAGARQFLFKWAMHNINSSVTLPTGLSMPALVGVASGATRRETTPALEAPFGFNVSGPITGGVTVQWNSPGATSTTNTTVSTQSLDPAALRALADAFSEVADKARTAGASAGECAALDEAILELRDLSKMAAPHAGWLRSSLLSAKAILENASGGILAELAKPHAIPLLAQALRSFGLP